MIERNKFAGLATIGYPLAHLLAAPRLFGRIENRRGGVSANAKVINPRSGHIVLPNTA